jgi:DNA-binding protein HU-beta
MANTTTANKQPVVTKDELVTSIASKAGLKKVDAQKAYDALLASVAESLAGGRDVRLSGIGSLRTNLAPARVSRNPRTGDPIQVPARRVVRFSASAELKGTVGQTAA